MEFDLVVIVCTFFNWRTKQHRRVSTEDFRVGLGSEASRGGRGQKAWVWRGGRDRHTQGEDRETDWKGFLYVSHTCQVNEQGGPHTHINFSQK